ncbi:hypothetical protein GINT2_001186 [Glugoides intestinalis]
METMVSNSNNTQKVIFLWQKLIWSKQPEGLLSTKSLIVISIVIFLIMTLRNGRMYYNNLLSGFLTILLTIISGIIFGKGLEILFRTLHIICSGAYGNLGFSLDDIFMSLSFGCIFVISGYCLLFNKKFYKLLRLLSVDAGNGIDKILANLKLIEKAELEKMKAEIEEMIKFIQKILDNYTPDKNKNISHLFVGYLNGMVFELEKMVFELEKMVNDPQEMNDNPEKRVGILQEMVKTLDKWVTYLIEYRGTEKQKDIHKEIMSRLDSHNILVKFRTAELAAAEAAKAARRF